MTQHYVDPEIMITLLWLLLALAVLAPAWLYLTWLHFAAIMNVKRVRDSDRLTAANDRMGRIAVIFGSFFNLVLALFYASFYFREWPRWGDWGLTLRIDRLIATDPDGWRGKKALWVRENYLNHLDPDGIHTS